MNGNRRDETVDYAFKGQKPEAAENRLARLYR